jgi:hypothetical protein
MRAKMDAKIDRMEFEKKVSGCWERLWASFCWNPAKELNQAPPVIKLILIQLQLSTSFLFPYFVRNVKRPVLSRRIWGYHSSDWVLSCGI